MQMNFFKEVPAVISSGEVSWYLQLAFRWVSTHADCVNVCVCAQFMCTQGKREKEANRMKMINTGKSRKYVYMCGLYFLPN